MEEKEIHLRDYFRVIKKRSYTLYTFFIISFILVLIGTYTATPVYMASTKVLIEKSEPDPLSMRYYYTPYDPEFLETQYQIISSYRVARKVVDLLALDKKYEDYFLKDAIKPDIFKRISSWFREIFTTVHGFLVSVPSPAPEAAVTDMGIEEKTKVEIISEMIAAGVMVNPVKESRIVSISFMSESPALAKMIANTVAKAYMDEILEIKMNSAGYTIKWMTEKADEERAKLEKSENALQEYMKAKDIITIEDKIAVTPQKLAEFSTQLTKAEAKRKEVDAVYDQLRRASGNLAEAETMPSIASNPTIQSLREQILKSEQHISELSQKYGEKHPMMIQAIDDLNVLKAKKKQEIGRVIASVKNEYELARANEDNLRKLLVETKDEALSLSEKFIQYGVLKRDVETNRLLYEALITKVKEQNVTEQTKTVNVWVVEEAKLPEIPTKPKTKQNMLLGLLVGLFGGIGLCFFVEYLDNTAKSPDDVEEKLGVSVLGVVELYKQKGKEIERITLEEPKSTLAESYKAIRTAVLLSAADAPPKSILVTSMSPQEGKTTTIVNLAVAIAQSDNKVVLIDGDLRRPRVHKIFGLAAGKGLSTYLAGASDMDIIFEGPLSNLFIIPSGPIPPNPSELLSSNRMKELVGELREKFDLILIDSPPCLSVTDSLILSRILDGAIIVAKSGATTYEALAKGLKSLKDINARTLGIVLNSVDMKKSDYYHYGYYNYYTAEEKEG